MTAQANESASAQTNSLTAKNASTRRNNTQLQMTLKAMGRQRWLYVLMAPTLTYFLIFKYIPLWNAQIAFKDFKPLLGVWGSPWVGFKHFDAFVNSFYFTQLLTNTVFFSIAKLLLGLPLAVMLALALHEIVLKRYRTFVQTVVYLPHFLSWVIMFGVLLMLLSPNNGLINTVIKAFGGDPIAFLTSPEWFRPVVILSDIWKETGWSTILYLAALLSISPHLYEAAKVDGANNMQRIWHISIPGIMPVIVLVTLLRLGHILDAGFNQIFVLYSVPVYSVGDIIDTWVYRQGILQFQFSLATAVGLFKGVFGLILILIANKAAKRLTGKGLF
jgi:putative aldouronate transport system permease protein